MLSQNAVENFGLKDNPFNTHALSLEAKSLLPIAQAFVGRDLSSVESRTLTNILRLVGGNRFVVEGEVGVGKTTFVNYHRYLWEHESSDSLLTTNQEISFERTWETKDFLLNILGALLEKLISQNGVKIVASYPLLQEIFAMTKVYLKSRTTWQASLFGFGAGYGKNEIVTVPPLSDIQLYFYFRDLVELIRSLGYAGVFLHCDNFDCMLAEDPKTMQLFFHKIRDILQTSHVYFAFVGYPQFFQQIIQPVERVRSVFFASPIYLPPLSESQVLELLEKRYQLLAKGKLIKPVDDDFVRYLYRLHGGKIRSILDSLSTVIANFPSAVAYTLSVKEAKAILTQVVSERLAAFLSPQTFAVLCKIAKEGECTNSEIARRLKLSPPATFHIVKELEQSHYIYVSRRQSQKIFYRANEQMKIIIENHHLSAFPLSPKLDKTNNTRSATQTKFLKLLSTQGKLTLAEFCRLAATPVSSTRKEVNGLVQLGLIAKHGFTKGMYYTMAEGE
jgi:DNA-binding MarR family transcriptional regulator